MKKIHWYYKFLVIFLIFFSMFFLLNKNMSNIVNSSGYKNYVNFIGVGFKFIDKYNIFRYKKVLEENEYLNKKVLIADTVSSQNDNLIKEIDFLKKTMNLKNTYAGYDITYAKVTNRNKMYWFSTLTIDNGSSEGVKEGDAVVTINGLIGHVKSVTKDYSTVKLITNSDVLNKISVMVKLDDKVKVGNIIGYEKPYILVEIEQGKNEIKKGSKLVTSGLGNFPKNIYIGDVEKITKDNYEISDIVYVLPKQDMNNINYVAVLKNK